jgi:small nuclear ribonucleoprotein (snRNP)-like protein
MSIKKTIEAAVKLTKKRGEDGQDYLKRVCVAIGELSDDDWKALGQKAQEWFNDAADAIEKNTDIADMPDEEEKAPASRRGAKKAEKEEEPAPTAEDVIGARVRVTNNRDKVVEGEIIECDEEVMIVVDAEGEEHEFNRARCKNVEFLDGEPVTEEDRDPQVDDEVEVVTKRDKTITGKVVEIDGDMLVIDDGKEEIETSIATAKSIKIIGAGEGAAPEAADPQVGDLVEAVTKRGKEVQGKVVEIDGDTLVLDDGTDEIEVDMSTAQSIKVTPAKKSASRASATAQPTARGRSTAQTTATKKEDEGKAKKITKAANKGVSVTGRMLEICCEEPGISVEAVAKKLKAEKLEFNEQTLAINHKTVAKVIELLKLSKHFK